MRGLAHSFLKSAAGLIAGKGHLRPKSGPRAELRATAPFRDPLWVMTREIEAANLNLKLLAGIEAVQRTVQIQNIQLAPMPGFMLDCKSCVECDIYSLWFRYWCAQLQERPGFQRDLWEECYLLQAARSADAVRAGARVLTIGAVPPAAINYLASKGADVTIVDKPGTPAPEMGDIDPLHDVRFLDRREFAQRVKRSNMALDQFPGNLRNFDVVWVVMRPDRADTPAAASDLMCRAVTALGPRGVVTCVFDYGYDCSEIGRQPTSRLVFYEPDVAAMLSGLAQLGAVPVGVDFEVGQGNMDRYTDIDVLEEPATEASRLLWKDVWNAAHLKVGAGGNIVSSFGVAVRKR